jgi:2-succinyl-5-enolpyruvyl-6-hydroxy-3-cyclohexene-1-carboxylate synthase
VSLQATLAATFVDEWWRAGVRDAVICPGSRSAPLAMALASDARVRTHVRLDERSAGFYALGLALASRRPVVLVVTSGTATGELHAAVMEADLAGVPLVVCTADRPPELQAVAAPQTVDQHGAFGAAARFVFDPGVLDEASRASWRSYASRLVAEASAGGRGPGPVHANLAFREPLVEASGPLPTGRPHGRPWHELVRSPAAPSQALERFVETLRSARRGVFVAGAGAAGALGDAGRDAIVALAKRMGWPVLAETRAWPREPVEDDATVVTASDQILRRAPASLDPDLVVHLGAPAVSKAVGAWCASSADKGTPQLLVEPAGRFLDPDRSASAVLVADPGVLALGALERLDAAPGSREWVGRWAAAEAAAQRAIDEVLASDAWVTEPWLARSLYEAAPSGSVVVASSSMPIRDLECFARARERAPRVLANRGANGIDGVVSTALGAAAGSGRPTLALVGDLAFLHDLSGLVWGALEEAPSATLVVVDNGGGGIFSMLPYAESVEPDLFARLFTTPQRHDPVSVAAGLGWRAARVRGRFDAHAALRAAGQSKDGPEVLVVEANQAATSACRAAVASAVGEAVAAAVAG